MNSLVKNTFLGYNHGIQRNQCASFAPPAELMDLWHSTTLWKSLWQIVSVLIKLQCINKCLIIIQHLLHTSYIVFLFLEYTG